MFLQKKKWRKNIQISGYTWLDYVDKPVMGLCKYVNDLSFAFSSSPIPYVNECRGHTSDK